MPLSWATLLPVDSTVPLSLRMNKRSGAAPDIQQPPTRQLSTALLAHLALYSHRGFERKATLVQAVSSPARIPQTRNQDKIGATFDLQQNNQEHNISQSLICLMYC
jgi:hypothetical protein